MIGSVFGRVATILGLGIQNRGRQEPNSADFFGLLPLSSERRKRETDSENDREPDPPHGHLDGGRLPGSLAERWDAHQHGAADDQSRSASRLIAAPHVHIIQTRSPSTPPSRSPQYWCSWKKAQSAWKSAKKIFA